MNKSDSSMYMREQFPYVDEINDQGHLDPPTQQIYSGEILKMCNSTVEDVHRLRQKAGIIVMRDPALTQLTSSMPAPSAVRSRAVFSTSLHARLATSCSFKQPFSNADSVITIDQTGIALLWDAQRMKKYEWFNVTRGGIMCSAVNSSGSLLLTGGLSCHVEAFSLGHDLNQRLYERELRTANFPLYNAKPGERSETGRPANFRCIFSGHNEAVSAVAFNDDNSCISFGHDGQVMSHDILTGLCDTQIDYLSPINTADHVRNSEAEYVLGLRSGRIFLGDLRTQRVGVEIVNSIPPPEKVKVLDDGHSMVAAYKTHLELFDLRSFGSYDSYKCPLGNVTSLDVSSSGRMLICGTDVGYVTTLDLVQNQWASKPFAKREDRISGVHLCQEKILVGSWDGSFTAYKIKS